MLFYGRQIYYCSLKSQLKIQQIKNAKCKTKNATSLSVNICIISEKIKVRQKELIRRKLIRRINLIIASGETGGINNQNAKHPKNYLCISVPSVSHIQTFQLFIGILRSNISDKFHRYINTGAATFVICTGDFYPACFG